MWKNSTGVARSMDGERTVSFGLKGSADILGIIKPSGKLLAIEVKTGAAKQNPQQVLFQKMITEFGGVYILARALTDLQILDNI